MIRYSISTRGLLTALLVLALSCGSTSLEPRYVAVNNTLSVMGYAQIGSLIEGSVPEGESIEFGAQFEAGSCYAVLALGLDGLDAISVSVFDGEAELGRDLTNDSHAAARICPTRSGEHRVVITADRGSGSYLVSSWLGASGSSSGGAAVGPQTGPSGGGTCDSPFLLADTANGRTDPQSGSNHVATCVQDDSPEDVYRFDVQQEGMYTFRVQADFDSTLSVYRNACDGELIGCNDDDQDTSTSRVDANLTPGSYFVVVDGYGQGSSGNYQIFVEHRQVQSPAQACSGARPISPGVLVRGDTSVRTDSFQSTCANNSPGNDEVFVMDVASPSRVRAFSSQSYDGSLYMRTTCDDFSTEIACNDDYMGASSSVITTFVSPGRYFFFVDGFSTGGGQHELQVDLNSGQGGGPGDQCQSAQTLTAGSHQADTFPAADDYAGSCGGQGAPDVVYEFSLADASQVNISLRSQAFPGVAYIQRRCGNTGSEVACSAGGQPLNATLQPGNYFLIIDGQSANDFGNLDFEVEIRSTAAAQRQCRAAQRIRPGNVERGSTVGEADSFQASCAGAARSPDRVYQFRLNRRSDVRLDSRTGNFDGALYVRSDCMQQASELGCDDDFQSTAASRVELTLDPGTYYVFMDGFSSSNAGDYELELTTGAPGTLVTQPPPSPPRPTPMPSPMPTPMPPSP